MSDHQWRDLLDSFEARVHAQRDALAMGAGVSDWEPPAVTEPLTPDLAERAIELLRECRELEDQIQRALDETAASLDRLDGPSASATEPFYFDSHI
jgi:hypothetical protein